MESPIRTYKFAPPPDVLPGVLLFNTTVAESLDVKLLLLRADIYPQGCMLHLMSAVRGSSEFAPSWPNLGKFAQSNIHDEGVADGALRAECTWGQRTREAVEFGRSDFLDVLDGAVLTHSGSGPSLVDPEPETEQSHFQQHQLWLQGACGTDVTVELLWEDFSLSGKIHVVANEMRSALRDSRSIW